ncbi:MAG: MlaD family protein, partial [Desulfobacteraceae bacterium]|nr:MlaD family protein [Desulfobacteraceae bacterium]
MSAKTNPKLIGAFVLGAAALVVAAVVTFGSGKLFSDRERCVLFFDSSVKGLSVGAPVLFRGVKVGSVVDISLVFDSQDVTFRIPVVIEVEFDRVTEAHADPRKKPDANSERVLLKKLIEKGLRAQLNTQSFLTGQLYVMIDLFPDSAVRLTGIKSNYVELPTIPSP